MAIIRLSALEFDSLFSSIEWAFDSFETRSKGEAKKPDMVHQILSDTRQCWLAVDNEIQAVALTEVKKDGVVTLTHCAGRNRDDWAGDLVDAIEDWAKQIDAWRFRVVCRPGWTKFLKTKGLKETHRVMEIDLG